MKFLHCSTVYRLFLSQMDLGGAMPDLSYEEALQLLMKFRFGWADYWVKHLRPLGWEGRVVVGNSEVLQVKWWREHRSLIGDAPSPQMIVLEQLRDFRPDVVLWEDLYMFDHSFRRLARAILPKARFIGWHFTPCRDKDYFDTLDCLVTGAKEFAIQFAHLGIPCKVVPLAFEASLTREVSSSERNIPVSFAGSIGSRSSPHENRHKLLLHVMRHTRLQVWGILDRKEIPLEGKRIILWVRKFLEMQFLKNRAQPPIFGLDYFSLLARSNIVFNSHIDVAETFAGNMRMFEATGMGCCLVTDWKSNLKDFFDPETEVVSYRCAEEAVEKINYMDEHPQVARAIAECGCRRTLAEHTYEKRAIVFDEVFRSVL